MKRLGFRRRDYILAGVVASAMAIASCAQVGTPTGGPIDTSPPIVVSTTPVDNAVSVPRKTNVVIQFSKTMRTESVDRSLYITPYPEPYPLLRWSSDHKRVRVEFDGALDENQTYTVTLGTDALDTRGNRLEQAHTFAFSTSAEIDSGVIAGTVYEFRDRIPHPCVGATVGLCRLDKRENEPDPSKAYAQFQTQTGNDGAYRFGYLSSGEYRVFAWRDNGNSLHDPNEAFGVASEDIFLTSDQPERVVQPILIAVHDIESPELHVIRAVDRHHVELEFSKPIRTDALEFAIVAPDTLTTTVIPTATASKRVSVWTEQQSAGVAYGVSARVRDEAGNWSEFAPDTTLFDGTSLPDTTAPRVISTMFAQPLIGPKLDSLVLWFSDCINVISVDSLSVTVVTQQLDGTWRIHEPNRLAFYPTSPLREHTGTARIPLNNIQDCAGNTISDTVSVPIQHTPIDSLGEMSGTVVYSNDHSNCVVQANSLKGKWSVETRVQHDGSWSFDKLPAGDYRLFTWDDVDGDERWTSGQFVPFISSERWVLTDTVTVRARWSTTGVPIHFDNH